MSHVQHRAWSSQDGTIYNRDRERERERARQTDKTDRQTNRQRERERESWSSHFTLRSSTGARCRAPTKQFHRACFQKLHEVKEPPSSRQVSCPKEYKGPSQPVQEGFHCEQCQNMIAKVLVDPDISWHWPCKSRTHHRGRDFAKALLTRKNRDHCCIWVINAQ